MVGYMVKLVGGWKEMDDRKKTALVMDLACADDRIGSAVDQILRSQLGGILQLIIDQNTHINRHPSDIVFFSIICDLNSATWSNLT